MTRMADRVFYRPLQPPFWLPDDYEPNTMEREQRMLREFLSSAPVIVADEICEYFYMGTSQEWWEIERDFPCLAPIFPRFWVEMRRPPKIVSDVFGETPAIFMPYAWGILFEAKSAEDLFPDKYARDRQIAILTETLQSRWRLFGERVARRITADTAPGSMIWGELSFDEQMFIKDAQLLGLLGVQLFPEIASWTEGIRWIMQPRLYFEMEKETISGPIMSWRIPIGDRGQVIGKPSASLAHAPEYPIPTEVLQGIRGYIFPALLALSFMHCTNVRVLTNDPPKKLSKAHVKRRGRPLLRFHTLEIKIMKEILRREGRSEEVGIAKALHICRGHFKDYRDGGGLFGKHQGLYWWQPQVRGTVKDAAVQKDYKIRWDATTSQKPLPTRPKK